SGKVAGAPANYRGKLGTASRRRGGAGSSIGTGTGASLRTGRTSGTGCRELAVKRRCSNRNAIPPAAQHARKKPPARTEIGVGECGVIEYEGGCSRFGLLIFALCSS